MQHINRCFCFGNSKELLSLKAKKFIIPRRSSAVSLNTNPAHVEAEHARRKLLLAEERIKQDLQRKQKQKYKEVKFKQMQAEDEAAGDLDEVKEELGEDVDLNNFAPSVSSKVKLTSHTTTEINTAMPLTSAVAFTSSTVIRPIGAPSKYAAHSYLYQNASMFVTSCDRDNIDPADVLPGGDNIRSSEMTL